MKILIIEDNATLVSRIKKELGKYYVIDSALTGNEGLSLAAADVYDMILLDLALPDTTGLEVCKQLQKVAPEVPILVLTGATPKLQVELLDNGADDFISKPYDSNTLRARIDAVARRRKATAFLDTIVVDDLIIDPSKRTVTRSGTPIMLRRKEYNILECLAKNPGRIMSRDMIIAHAWDTASTTWGGAVDVHVKQLRDKVDRPFTYPLIKTVYGVGYSIIPGEGNTSEDQVDA